MSKVRSKKFWIIFWLVSIIGLTAFYFFLNQKTEPKKTAAGFPAKQEFQSVFALSNYIFQKDNTTKNFLILFQNNNEIRPGGGFIGAFGILKIDNGKISDLQIHDTGNFDGRIPDNIEPPKPIKEKLNVSWKFRDSNFSPDFKTDALKAEEFYRLGNGQENFDGVIGITTNVLMSFLKVTGPISLPDYPGTYADENAVMQLEYQVEKGFDDQGISRGDRKSIMNELGDEVLKKTLALGNIDKLRLASIIQDDLNRKDIQLYFKNEQLQAQIEKSNWGGQIDQNWKNDYLMLVDANLGAWKSDYFVKRLVEYTVDLRPDTPRSILKITYRHTATEKNWLTHDYLSYLRTYVPESAWLDKTENFVTPIFEKEFNKKSFGSYVSVLTSQEKIVEMEYSLSPEISKDYALKIQKQAGLNDIPYKVKIISRNGQEKNYEFDLNTDLIITE